MIPSSSASNLSLPARRLPLPLAFAAIAAVIGVALYASATPSPLYGVYQARWHFSTPVLSLVYATYAVGVLASLLLIGGISDQTGRRPVLKWSLLALLVSAGLHATATSVTWLFVARAIQGLATGAALGAAGAALIDLHPTGDVRRAALVNGAVSLAGLGTGAFVSALLVQFLPAPRVVPFLLVATLVLLLIAAVRVVPGTDRRATPPAAASTASGRTGVGPRSVRPRGTRCPRIVVDRGSLPGARAGSR